MKRSEMITLICKTFEMEGLGSTMREKDADAILRAIQKAGMLPPQRIIDPERWVDGEYGIRYLKGNTLHRSWEPEDEKK